MKFQRILSVAAGLLPSALFAHPGHEATGLHIHAGTPSASNSIELWLVGAVFATGILAHFLRSSKNR